MMRSHCGLKLVLSLGVALAAMASSVHAAATFDSMAQRLPAGTNAIVAIDVAGLLNTPFAKEAGWAANLAATWERGPAMIPPGASRMLMASEVRTSTMEPRWEMVLMDMEKMPTVQELAQSDGGHVDRIWDKDAACSPINAYFLPLDNRILASITPAARAEIAKWVRTPVKPEGNVTSPYINSVLKSLGPKTQAVMAVELEGSWSLPVIRRFLDGSGIKEITPKYMDMTVTTLGSMVGIRLDITVADKVTGLATIEFERDAGVLKDSARPIMMAVLDAGGMHIEEVKDWTVSVSGKRVLMQGALQQPSLRKLFSIVQSPIPAAVVAKAPAGTPGSAADPAAASQRYFKSICLSLDSLRESTSLSATAAWFRNTSKRIDQLPILNVDPALVEWGTMVSTKLKMAGATLAVGGTEIQARVSGVMNPEFATYEYDDTSIATVSPAYANTVRERQRVAAEQKAQTTDQALRILTDLAEARPRIRAEMTQKYKVEF